MILKSIELRNIRSHKDTVINFDKGITVLSGRTGCGKSTFFMSLAYALFGADVNLSNNSILRRNAKNGFVKVVFNSRGINYEIMRGMKKSGDKIIVDPDSLWIKEEGNSLNIIARSAEVNEKILELLSYPSDVKPKDLFEVMSYAKQDEIRKLIELTTSEREKHIDRVLQLSKYELTYENLKLVLNKLSTDFSLLKGKIEGLSIIEKSLVSKEKELVDLDLVIKKLSEDLVISSNLLSEKKKIFDLIKKKRDELELVKESYDSKKGLLDGIIIELKKLESELKNYPDLPKESIIESLIQDQASFSQERRECVNRINELNDEFKSFTSLGCSCPLCKQEVSKEYAINIKNELLKKISVLEVKDKSLVSKINELSSKIISERKSKELIDSLKIKSARVIELHDKITYLEKALNELIPKINDFDYIKKEFNNVSESYLNIVSSHNVLVEKKNNAEYSFKKLLSELSKAREELVSLNNERNEALVLEKKIALLSRLREDIRSIRTVVRSRFLEDFRHEFQRKYEEIRQDDVYSVDITNDYEPVAYSEGNEVSVTSLSGGERTSVALAYRLALSEIASQASSLEHSDLLMLDEPTTGFDRKDINALPEALRAIKRIPQIIIVTHEDELKEAADIKYEVIKNNGVSEVKKKNLMTHYCFANVIHALAC